MPKAPSPRMEAARRAIESGGTLQVVMTTSYGKKRRDLGSSDPIRVIEYRATLPGDPDSFYQLTRYQAQGFMSESQRENHALALEVMAENKEIASASRANRFGRVLDITKARKARMAECIRYQTMVDACKIDGGTVYL